MTQIDIQQNDFLFLFRWILTFFARRFKFDDGLSSVFVYQNKIVIFSTKAWLTVLKYKVTLTEMMLIQLSKNLL